MKRYVKASSEVLMLAKGIVIGAYLLRRYNIDVEQFKRNKYVSDLGYEDYLVAYTYSIYNPSTSTLSSDNLINHEELVHQLGIEQIPSNEYISFRVDKSSRNSYATELTTSGMNSRNAQVVDKLAKMFNVDVSPSSISGGSEWQDISTPEFKSEYARIAKYAKEFAENTSYDYPYFGVCFAIIDRATNQGLLATEENFLITAYSFAEYKEETKKFAKELGGSVRDFIFKSTYSQFTYEEGPDAPTSNIKNLRKVISSLRNALSSYDNITVQFSNKDLIGRIIDTSVPGDYKFIVVDTRTDILDPEIEFGANTSTRLYIPSHFQYYPGFEDEILSIFDEMHSN